MTLVGNIILGNETEGGEGGGVYCEASDLKIIDNLISENRSMSHGSYGGLGGGIYSIESFLEITDNTISKNEAYLSDGGGIYCSESNLMINENDISDNMAVDGDGGGIYSSLSSLEIFKNNISGNEAGSGDGGGIYSNVSVMEIVDNTISDNRAFTGDGGGIGSSDSNLALANNLIVANFAGYGGGGIYFRGHREITLNGVTLADNTAKTGYGLYIGSHADVIIVNSILWDDPLDEIYSEASNIQVTFSDVWGYWPGVGNIEADPLFADQVNNDYHLTFNSPCRGSGDNTAVTELTDFEGDPRMAWGGTVDMGADEFHTHLYYKGLASPNHLIEGKLVGLPGTYPTGLWIGLAGVLDPPIETKFGQWHLNYPWIQLFPIQSIPSNGIFVIEEKLPQHWHHPAPYDLHLQGLVGLNSDSLTNLCVMEVR